MLSFLPETGAIGSRRGPDKGIPSVAASAADDYHNYSIIKPINRALGLRNIIKAELLIITPDHFSSPYYQYPKGFVAKSALFKFRMFALPF